MLLNYHAEYRKKLTTVEQALEVITNNCNVFVSLGAAEPLMLLDGLGKRVLEQDLRGIKVFQLLPVQDSLYLKPELSERIMHISMFAGRPVRELINQGFAEMIPCHFHDVPQIIQDYLDVDVFMTTVSPMDEHGFFSLGTSVDYSLAALKKAKKVILEINPNMPRTFGQGIVHISEVDFLIESERPLPELFPEELKAEDLRIGEYIAELVENESTLQLGIGGIPNAVAKFLKEKKNLGIHTEMITDSMVDLVEAGVITGSAKSLHPYKIVGTFALGTKKLYSFLNNNPMVEMHPVSYTNNPCVIAQNKKMISINTTLEIDLWGQCASESIGTKIYSGTGGQADFAQGVLHSPGGKGIIALYSTAKNGQISKIVPTLKPGAIVTTSKNDVDYIVTEYGVAKLRGKTYRERAKALINIAHPDFRDELKFQAKKLNIL
ncbi:acetyl-CoA hydrolase/transferase family protein [Carboxydothermus hydrogenoformans]|uniref:4-hydroxybutyrate coenzyme A transferase n=1 Tax=Carboxydothermus hydrogenoformans (strain ATCC BAA-161 / DSM 6008 / Z-2901) TaxID=246194 RepID=Q3ACH6_CARHZ|nr:acetyl-CoA hydrolase/transferase C-terminal domain-containing protein [Carboxydothermus hydrogenoformans]ABB14126.1 4-hydroxybutyrate coenzyme A transferase [Carboxydothermus hydrogenoformans Z-2901]